MAYENLTTFTEVDPYNRWEQTTTRNTGTNIDCDEISSVYKDYGAGFFGNYRHFVDIKLTDCEGYSGIALWAVSDELNEGYWDWENGHVIEAYGYDDGEYELYLTDFGPWNDDYTDTILYTNTPYYLIIERSGLTLTCKIYITKNDRDNDTGNNLLETLSVTCEVRNFRYLYAGCSSNYGGTEISSGYSENFNINLTNEETVDINNDFRMFPTLRDIDNDFRMVGQEEEYDINNDFRMIPVLIENIDFNNDFKMVEVITSDVNNDFKFFGEKYYNINNKFSMVEETTNNILNIFHSVYESVSNFSNDFRMESILKTSFNNDFRMLSPWQVPEEGEVGFQSAGKTEVKVYINSVEQTDVDVNSIICTENLNAPAVASFNLGRAYDSSKPAMDSNIEIKYKGILLYKGYVTEINPTDSPESIKVSCQGEYWNLNKTKKYFFVGRKPANTNEYYYETIKDALNDLGFNYDIGNFIPQTIDLYGNGVTNAISNLVQNSGNFGWFIKPDGSKRLWQAGEGNIIDLEPQQLNQNLGLYQVIRHSIRESIIGLVNKFRVLMGNWTVRENSEDPSIGSGTKTYTYVYPVNIRTYAIPAWNPDLSKLVKGSTTGYGFDYQNPALDYKDVFRKFYLPDIDPEVESYTDKYPPLVEILWGDYPGWTNKRKYLTEGFSIDYGFKSPFGAPLGASDLAKPNISFSEPMAVYDKNSKNECYNIRPKIIKLYLWKEYKVTYSVNPQSSPDDAPIEDPSNPLMFYSDKMGSYPETIIETLGLASLSKQDGYIIKDEEGNIIEYIPSWDDTDFAKDYADWRLSKNCDKKITGSIDITIDALLYYNIDLSKRIKINGIIDPVNIVSITYNLNSFIATLNIEKNRYYRRTENYPYHGE